MEKFDKRMLKINPEELQQYLAFKRKGSKVPAKKGKGSYDRRDFKKGVAQDDGNNTNNMDSNRNTDNC